VNEKAAHSMCSGSRSLRSRIGVWRVLPAGLAALLVTGLLGVAPARAVSAASAAQDVTGRVTSGMAGKCLDNTGARAVDGNKVEIWACNGNAGSQLWTAEADGTIRIKDMCLDVRRNGTANGTKVDLYTCNAGANQQWLVSGSTLVATHAGKCLDDPHSSAKNGTQLDIWSCNGGGSQVWKLPPSTAATRAATAATALQLMYNNTPGSRSRGLFCSGKPGGACWWQSANELDALIGYMARTGSKAFLGDIATTFAYAGREAVVSFGPFLDNFFDDDGWWGVAWLDAYKLTGDSKYLRMAESILAAIKGTAKTREDKKGWDATTCGGGGVWQHTGAHEGKGAATKDAIANELYLTLAARLYVATGKKDQAYLADAQHDWAWFRNAGNADHLAGSPTSMIHAIPGLGALIYPDVFEGTNGKCQVKTGTVFFTLRLGQFVAALTSLYKATGNQSYLTEAASVADCVTSAGCGGDRSHASPPLLDSRGILTEPCKGSPDNCRVTGNPDYLQYKGVFMRDLSCLPQVAGDPAYSAFIQAQASAVYADDQNPETAKPATQHLNRFGFTWDRWSAAGINWASQGTALDALNAAIGGSALMC
jgi:glycosyl hydrolase family 76/ricin-type beta-trefoil lectin protein